MEQADFAIVDLVDLLDSDMRLFGGEFAGIFTDLLDLLDSDMRSAGGDFAGILTFIYCTAFAHGYYLCIPS